MRQQEKAAHMTCEDGICKKAVRRREWKTKTEREHFFDKISRAATIDGQFTYRFDTSAAQPYIDFLNDEKFPREVLSFFYIDDAQKSQPYFELMDMGHGLFAVIPTARMKRLFEFAHNLGQFKPAFARRSHE